MKIIGRRITILGLHYEPEMTGNAPYTTSLAEGLASRGHTVTVVTAHPHYPEWKVRTGYGGWKSRERVNGVDIVRLKHFVPSRPTNLSRFISEVSFGVRLLFASWESPDIVLLVSPALFSTSVATLRTRFGRRRASSAVWVQDIYSLGITETGAGGSRVARMMAHIESKTLASADGVVAIHDRFQAHLTGTLSLNPHSIEVIRNWSHLPEQPQTDRAEFRASMGWGTNEIIALHAGNQGAKQGLENVVEAARLADAGGLAVRFVLLGDGNQRKRLEELSQGVQRIDFLDPLDGDAYQKAMLSSDVLLVNELPGVAEMSVPSKLTSYFSTGRPVVAATAEGSVTAGEVLLSGGGVCVPAGQPHDLVTAVLDMGNGGERSRAIGSRGLAYRKTVLGEDKAVDHFERWLVGLVASREASATKA